MRHGEALRREVIQQLYAGLVALSRDPVIGPLAVRTRYLPAEVEQVLAGDFYGVLEGPNGEAFIMVGDVSGHGPGAAATATHLRAAWRGLAASAADLAEIARILNDLLHAEQRGGTDLRFATLCLAAFSPDLSTAQFLVAGHPPPVLVFDDECIELRLRRQPPLGVAIDLEWRPEEIPLPAGVWSMVIYTDGLVEGRRSPGGPRPFGMPALCQLLTRNRLPITDESLDDVLQAVRAANGGPMVDDIVAIAVSPAESHGRSASSQRAATGAAASA
jgi:serine phosphatase RsbU (regulator of sigma subunit)